VENSYHLQLGFEGGNGECHVRDCEMSSLLGEKTGRLRSRSPVTFEDFITLVDTAEKKFDQNEFIRSSELSFLKPNQIKNTTLNVQTPYTN
jgi:hypothetical protein